MSRPALFGSIGAILYLLFVQFNFQTYASGQWLDINEPYLTLIVLPCLFFLFMASSGLNLPTLHSAFLNLCISMTVIFAFPNISFPVGGTYFEQVQADFGELSLFTAFFTLIVFVHFYFGRNP